MADIFLLEMEKAGAAGEILLNDVPIRVWPDGANFETTDPVNQWVRTGGNKLSARLDLPQEGTDGAPRLRAVLKRMGQDVDDSAVEIVAELKIDSPEAAAAIVWPLTGKITFSPAAPPASRLWPELTLLEDSDALRAEALALLERLHGALATTNFDELSTLLRWKALDVAMAYGFPADQALSQQLEFFSGVMEAPGWDMAPLESGTLQIDLVADETMLWLHGPSGAPALRSASAGGAQLELQIYLARVRGTLMVVR